MAWQCSGRTNAELIENMFSRRVITSSRVKDAMMEVDRAHFCPNLKTAYEDSPQSIGHAATISAPHMHASACEALLPFLHSRSRILDIGSGSGYLTAVLAELCSGEGRVVGLEHIPVLQKLGEGNMLKSQRGKDLIRNGKVEFVIGDGRKGWVDKEGEGWDAIHVGAAAVTLHENLVKQLKSPGRLFIPVEDEEGRGQWIWVVDKDEKGVVRRTRKEGVRYVPLTDAPR